ncbi:hypothetical protein L5515_006722 [Caenorhabditis briggsae]|uniref:glutathione transferase n=1 Tax=Caenorhabditis briggsae TaxID=6238 RepID=A0AAE9JJ47_CAEBR|nr:hypothetical protein L5515_006722 [Caenorhabditis briggsae]
MTVPQLFYFDLRGFGEYIRLLFRDNQIEFEDIRLDHEPKDNCLDRGLEWQELKKSMIFGQMPCLKHDGKEYVQTGAIMRHLARIHGLNGSDEDEATFLDMFFEGVRDTRKEYSRFIYYDSPKREEMLESILPRDLADFEKLMKVHPGEFIIGDKPNYADYILFEELDVYTHLHATILDKYPSLKAFWVKMWQRPNLKAYLEKRKADRVWINAIEKGLD